MKKKFIALGAVAVLLLVAVLLFTIASPLMVAPDVDEAEVAGVVAAETADLAVMDSSVVMTIDNAMVPETINPTELTMWAALGASLTIIAVANRRRIDNLLNLVGRILGSSDIIADTGAGRGGGTNKFILPAAA